MYTLTCSFCGTYFERKSLDKRTSKVFCSHSCYSKSRIKHSLRTCECCGERFRPRTKTNRTRFCSIECYKKDKSSRKVDKTCPCCGNLFTVNKSIQHRYIYCSMKCKRASMGGVTKQCLTCGKEFHHKQSDIARGLNRNHCSEECRRPAHTAECKTCGTEFRYVPSNKSQFCSFSCYRKYNGETSLESTIRESLERLEIPFIQEHQVLRYSIDFAIPSKMLAIEADGDYWHDDEKDSIRDSRLSEEGWHVVRIKESEVKQTKSIDGLIMSKILERLPSF